MVSLDVTNSGSRAGDAVPQLYVRHLGSRVDRPALQLAGFRRVHLAAGQTRRVQIPLEAKRLAYWDVAGKRLLVEEEPIELMIGASSADIKLRRQLQVR